ncbi:MAG: hypothetical protein II773_08520 [Oscillospiraceae bacterium]|nr:hypothetical protein [Oscillospiraceae bacterium]
MSKISIEVNIPGNAKTYEFQVDDRMKIGSAKKQIMSAITESEGYDVFNGTKDIAVCSVELEGLIEDGESFHTAGIRNGSRLAFV